MAATVVFDADAPERLSPSNAESASSAAGQDPSTIDLTRQDDAGDTRPPQPPPTIDLDAMADQPPGKSGSRRGGALPKGIPPIPNYE
ncbi:MAG: hypothetical protein ACTSX7_10540, partial [Alphaproteobacteria bacterium]